jgi:hypothetical protein
VGAGNEIRRSEKRLLGMFGLWRSLSESGAKNSATVRLLQLAEKVSRLRRVGTGQRLGSKVGLVVSSAVLNLRSCVGVIHQLDRRQVRRARELVGLLAYVKGHSREERTVDGYTHTWEET